MSWQPQEGGPWYFFRNQIWFVGASNTVPYKHGGSNSPLFWYEISNTLIWNGDELDYDGGVHPGQNNLYLTVGNENYAMRPIPDNTKEGILKGMYKLRASTNKTPGPNVQLLGSGSIINQALQAQKILEENYAIAADVWNVTSYNELRRDALNKERWNTLHPGEEQQIPYVTQCLKDKNSDVKNIRECFDLCSLVEFAKYQANKNDFENIVKIVKKNIGET